MQNFVAPTNDKFNLQQKTVEHEITNPIPIFTPMPHNIRPPNPTPIQAENLTSMANQLAAINWADDANEHSPIQGYTFIASKGKTPVRGSGGAPPPPPPSPPPPNDPGEPDDDGNGSSWWKS
ncbi:hypothetical protein BT96DRAFT_998996 [Gymnopus androsaceus JB14]|uniref:Uncharacterized protein n=1 Tax=Gymnopus androsaceus JB14 TaxID=1447944 RepID=A0A6A4H9L4_9AGAR|nr:hypothetical protein BT96DRAFT_998996 [Gymnopus androsaceus JB14]